MKIASLNFEDRPREKALMNGISSLSDSELVAILISSGYKGESSLEVSTKLFNQYPNLNSLSSISYQELKSFKGLGKAKSLVLLSTFELARRINLNKSPSLNYLDALKRIKGNIYVEEFHLLCLDSSSYLIRDYPFASLSGSLIHINPKALGKVAIRCGASKVAIVHTHLTNFAYPSKEDVSSTLKLKEEFAKFDIEFFDSLILSKDKMYSFRAEGLI